MTDFFSTRLVSSSPHVVADLKSLSRNHPRPSVVYPLTISTQGFGQYGGYGGQPQQYGGQPQQVYVQGGRPGGGAAAGVGGGLLGE